MGVSCSEAGTTPISQSEPLLYAKDPCVKISEKKLLNIENKIETTEQFNCSSFRSLAAVGTLWTGI